MKSKHDKLGEYKASRRRQTKYRRLLMRMWIYRPNVNVAPDGFSDVVAAYEKARALTVRRRSTLRGE